MKDFLGEYGLIIVVAVVVLLMAVAATPIGGYIRDAITATIKDFIGKSGVTGVEAPDFTPAA